ncbi:MAG: Stk1 family PASTA domain-containing Ser/Thr kinase [Acidimicrobiales bacterium]
MARQPAQVYSDRYEIIRQIARGGMAEVYLARDQLLDRPVALKVLYPELSIDPSFVERFRREAQSAANLSHPNIVSVYDWGEEDDTYYIVMEFVDGRALSAVIRSGGPLPPDRAAAIGADVAAALAFAHRSGVVHRDVKPGNVLLDDGEHVKVTDFGIARASDSKENLTQTGAVMGTATYFSPEQAQGARVDARSDVYSLGVVLYEMATGQPPFSGDNPVSIAYKHVKEQPVPPRERNPSIPGGFEAVILKAMAKDPADRYCDADELRADLQRYRQGQRVRASVAPPRAPVDDQTMVLRTTPSRREAPPTGATRVLPAPVPYGETSARRSGAYVGLLVFMLAVLAVLLFLLARTLGVFGGDTVATRITVPAVTGELADDAKDTLVALGLRVEQKREDNEADADVVFDQDPEADTRVERDSLVTLRVSKGQQPVDVPSVVGQNEEDAITALDRLGLEAETVLLADETQPAGRVISQQPRAGTEAEKGSSVTLTVSSGRPRVAVPSVAGKDATAANDDIVNAGLKVRTVNEPSSTVERGKVVRTDPAAEAPVDKGATVTVFVSSGAETTRLPNVVGRRLDDATATLEALGVTVRAESVVVSSEADDGRVLEQSPSSGTEVQKGSTVVVRVGRRSTTSSTAPPITLLPGPATTTTTTTTLPPP